ncbi:uncharacterized protein ACNS7B_011682 [Menidia menidia]
MRPLILTLLCTIGVGEAVFWQRLTCPVQEKHGGLLRVWCRRSSDECCQGLSFGQNASRLDGGLLDGGRLDGGPLRVTQDDRSFAVEHLGPGPRGVYWCGVLGTDNTLIKLAEAYFHGSWASFVWSYARWILMPLLPTVTVATNFCLTNKKKNPAVRKQTSLEG